MSQATPHTYRNKRGTFKVAFDELEPADTITMRQATFEKLANVKISDATVAVRGEPGAIPRAGRAVVVESIERQRAMGDEPCVIFPEPSTLGAGRIVEPEPVDHEANASLEEKQHEE